MNIQDARVKEVFYYFNYFQEKSCKNETDEE